MTKPHCIEVDWTSFTNKDKNERLILVDSFVLDGFETANLAVDNENIFIISQTTGNLGNKLVLPNSNPDKFTGKIIVAGWTPEQTVSQQYELQVSDINNSEQINKLNM